MRSRRFRTLDQLRVSTVQTSDASPLDFTTNSHLGCASQMISAFGTEFSRPPTAGNVCTMSPNEPSRITRKRGSVMRRLANLLQQFARGVIFRIANDGYANSQALRHRSF